MAAKNPEAPAAEVKEEKKGPRNVHELSYVNGKGWAVKRQGSEKVIKYFKTKLEATEYIVKISENTGTTVVFKLKNGKYQKYESAMRALSYAKSSGEDD